MFKFRLQKLLDIRLDNEEKSKMKFQEAQQKKMLVEQKLDNLQNNYKRYSVQDAKHTIIEKKIRQNYLNALTLTITETKGELVLKVKEVEERRNELKQSQIDRKTVDTLKEKQHAAYLKQEEQKEQKTNDEFALYGFMRNLERR